jgi:SpoIID/LytB domain protein
MEIGDTVHLIQISDTLQLYMRAPLHNTAQSLLMILLLGIGVFSLFNHPHLSTLLSQPVLALDEIESLQREITELEKLKKLSEDATRPLEKEVTTLESRIKNAQSGIIKARADAKALAADIEKREEELAVYYTLLTERVRSQYKQLRVVSPLLIAFASKDAADLEKGIMYHTNVREKNQALIHLVGKDILQLEADKKALEKRQVVLASLQKQLDAQSDFFKGEIQKAKAYQKELTGKIAALSAKQQAILSARSGTSITSVGEVPLADDPNASIAFRSQAPGNSFAVFSFGGYTHRNGMSQYGAKARAEAGQSVEDILKAYYPNATLKKDYSAMGEIDVQGFGKMSFEDRYLQGIYEMPGSWHSNALKAQAIAARTYAIKYTGNGSKAICTTEACQVFKNSKKGGEWEKAVNETKGWVLVDGGGSPVSTQYASTHGGYANTSGWDTTDKNGGGDWSTRAYESIAKSPWFYKSWYRNGYSSSGANCGRNHPWMSQEEMADIINAWLVRKDPKGADTDRIVPVTINTCNVGGGGGNPYSMEELRGLANNSGGAVTSISDVTVSHSGSGQTATVTFQTNRGTVPIPGSEFKSTFNIRAPGYLRIPQSSFAFFNVEFKR